MKLKQVAAGFLAAAMVVTSIPAANLGGISVWGGVNQPKASIGPVRYRAIPASDMTITADWKDRADAPLDNMKSDTANFALSRYNTGGTPRSSMLEGNNNIYLKLNEAKNLSKLVWWTDEDQVSGGYGWNVHNGTVTRLQVSVTTEAVESAEALGSLADDKWTVQTLGEGKGEDKDVRFDSNEDDNAEEESTTVAHNIDLAECFQNLPTGITGVRIQVLNTAGTYTPKDGQNELKDERDTYINGREIDAYEGEIKLENLTAYVDFATETGCDASKLVDGDITKGSKMSSLLDPSTNEAKSPVKHDYGKYFANNNIYFDIGQAKSLGRLTYVPGVKNGSVTRCNIYTSNETLTGGETVEDIADDKWKLVFSNVPKEPEEGEEEDTSGDWTPYDPQLSAVGNSKIANFSSFSTARYVRMEVINTQTPGRDTVNKWINAGRVYIYEAEPVYTGEEENVALGTVAGGSTTIKCYTGSGQESHEGSTARGPALIIDGKDVNNNYWGGRMLLWDETGAGLGNANYVVLDLGGNVTDLSAIKLSWQAKAWATDYKIETAAACEQDGDITGNIKIEDVPTDGWKEVVTVDREDVDAPLSAPDNWTGDDLKTNALDRYVRITMTRTNKTASGLKHGGLREVEIYGIRETGELATIALDSAEPVYKGALRRPATPASERYHIDGDIDNYEGYDWYKGGQKLDKQTATFEAGTYKLEVKIATKLLVADTVQATIGGAEASVSVDSNKNDAGETVLTISREYTIESPEAAKTALSEYLETGESGKVKQAYETNNRNEANELIYRISTWNAFVKAYNNAKGMLALIPGMPNPDSPDEEVPDVEVWYLKSEYESALAEVQAAYGALRKRGQGTPIDTTKDVPDVTVKKPVAGAAVANAALTYPGEVENEDLALVKERDHDKNYFRVDKDGYIHGRVTAPNTDPKNSVFNIDGETKFLIRFTAKPKNIGDERESLIGKFNKGYGIQLLPAGGANNSSAEKDQLIIYGYHNANDWMQTGYLIPDDSWYDKDHDIVAIFNGGYFHLFVDGVAGSEGRKGTATGEILSRPLTLDNSATFVVGYNPQPGNVQNPTNRDEDFQGGLKDVKMYVGNNCPQDFSTILADNLTQDQFNTALTALLADKEPDMKLTGDPSKYDVTSTKWFVVEGDQEIPMKEGDIFEAYRDYKVAIEVSANENYYFTGQNGVLRTGKDDADILGDAIVNSESEEVIAFTHIFRAEGKHPKDALCEYLDGLADELGVKVENDTLVNKDKETDARKYTVKGWQTFMEAYEAAAEQAQEEKKWGEENNVQAFQDALDDLQTAVDDVKEKTAANTCECTIGTVTLTGEDVSLTEASVEKTLSAEFIVGHENCMKHSSGSLPEGEAQYEVTEGDAIASVSGNKLTITGEGTIKVMATVTIKDGETEVDSKTSETPAVYTVTSPKAEDITTLLDAIKKIDSYHEDDYTPESWQKLKDAIDAANALAEIVDGGGTISQNEMNRAISAIDTAIAELEPKGGNSVNALRDLVASLADSIKKEDYTVESYNAFVTIFNQAVEELNKENPDAARCAALLDQLKKAKENLVTNAQDIANAKTEVSGAIAAADAVYNAGQKDYDAASWKAFTDAYNAAKNAPANADAATLRKLAAALKAAQAALKPAAAAGLTNGYVEKVGTIQYKVLSADKKTVMAYRGTSKKAKSITIPATVKIKGITCKVTQIGAKAFSGYNRATKITIGKNVTTIGKQAFLNCKKINQIILKGKALKNEKSIKANAFKGTSKKKVKIKWPKGIKKSQKNKLIKGFKKRGLKV